MGNLVCFAFKPRSNDRDSWYSVYTVRHGQGGAYVHESIVIDGALAMKLAEALCDRHGIHGVDRAGLMTGSPMMVSAAPTLTSYTAQSARDAQRQGYGDSKYWDYLERNAIEHRDYFAAKGDEATAAQMMTRSLSDSLMGNDGN